MKKLLNLKRLLKARNCSGFTLVEVILSSALLSILILGIMFFVTPVLKMVTSGQKNARATMLSETVDTYIAGVLRTAAVIEVFQNIEFTSTSTADLNLRAVSPAGAGVNKIDEFMATDDNGENYEVRALAIVTKDDGAITTQGIRLYNATVDPATLNLKADSIRPANQALNDLMFEGLYATIKLENFQTQDPATGADTGANAKGYRIETKVYVDAKCYNIESATRDKSMQAFTGVTFFEALNLQEPQNVISVVSDDIEEAMEAHDEVEGKLYCPATIIYYVAPKK